ncbi:glycoprotein 3-alpha-L-fucosyltransferase A-like [Tubulanus polymorphus]|uniref:glycoprotein 3-alpha-L-fucosyltransferase A-like n=1 Tax=Tubulanus polymorphus TaxID=672921 RepID=UPI003DA2DF1A
MDSYMSKRYQVYFIGIVLLGVVFIICAFNDGLLQSKLIRPENAAMSRINNGGRRSDIVSDTSRDGSGGGVHREESGSMSSVKYDIGTTNSLHRRALEFVKAERLLTLSDSSAIWPEMDSGRRLTAQLLHIPRQAAERSKLRKPKTILSWGGINNSFIYELGEQVFQNCPVNTCKIIENRFESSTADVILIERHVIGTETPEPKGPRPAHQIRVMFAVESPLHTPLHNGTGYQSGLNWTATYRRDSTIPVPYGVFVPFDESVRFDSPKKNYARGKRKKVAWFVSNCYEKNDRQNLAKELSKYIDVDVYGDCGALNCTRDRENECLDLLNTSYKFYLAFENSNCREYITEKFFLNGLSRDVLPIVYGAHKDDYERVSPPHSFIHVDDFESPKQLAEYLHILDRNDDLYNSYFRWKGTGRVVTKRFFWCRLCMLAHADDALKTRYVSNYDRWWRPEGICKLNSGYQRWTPPTYGTAWS